MKHNIEAYVDGSFNIREDICGWAFYVIWNEETYYDSGYDMTYDSVSLNNVGGEILSVLNFLKWLLNNIEKKKRYEVTVYYDYEGIEKWVTGEWRANKPFTRYYRDRVRDFMDDYSNITFYFEHVKAHSGNEWNEKVDRLAKEACRIC